MKWSEFVGRFFHEDSASAEVAVQDRYLDLRISPLRNKRGQFVGRLVVWRDITDLKNTQLMLEQLATVDELTLAYNRRHFMKLAEAQVNKALRHGSPLTLAVIDLDYFKDINDQYGHPVGDKVLKEVSNILRERFRDFDLFGRLGGEEFALLMPDTNEETAFQVSERLRVAMMENHINIDGRTLNVTFSLGLTGLKGADDMLSSMLRRADHALYAAKKAGRNRVLIWDKSTEEKAGPLQRTMDED